MQIGKNTLDGGVYVYVGKNRNGFYFTFDALGDDKKFYTTACVNKSGCWRYNLNGVSKIGRIDKAL
jgi:hypothetical protein